MNIEQLREFCLAFPHTSEDIKWGSDLCFCVGGKMFAVTNADADDGKVSFKCTPEKFAELTERDGITPAPYAARYHWVAVERQQALSETELKELVKHSYELVLAKLPAKFRRNG